MPCILAVEAMRVKNGRDGRSSRFRFARPWGKVSGMKELSASDRNESLRRFYRRGLAFCAMLGVAMAFRSEGLTDWDSWDYASKAVMGHSSELLLGRWWFIALMRGAYLGGKALFDVGILDAFLPMQTVCMLMMAGAVVAGMAWTYRLTRSDAAEMLFAALVIPAPTLALYASAVMTESLTLLSLSLAMLLWEMARENPPRAMLMAMAAGLCFGVAVDVREPAAVLFAWPVVSCLLDGRAQRWKQLAVMGAGAALTLGIGIYGAWAWFAAPQGYWNNIAQWTRDMSAERNRFSGELLSNAGYLVVFCVAAAPVSTLLAVPAAAWAFVRQRRLFGLAVATLPLALVMLSNHDLSVNARHPAALAWMLAPVSAGALSAWLVDARRQYRRRLAATLLAALAGGAGVFAASWNILETRYFPYVDCHQRAFAALLKLPPDSVIIPGPGTPAAQYLLRTGIKNFIIVRSCWEWPGENLPAVLAGHVESPRPVFANLVESDWKCTQRLDEEWRQLRQALAGYQIRRAAGSMFHIRKAVATSAPASRPS